MSYCVGCEGGYYDNPVAIQRKTNEFVNDVTGDAIKKFCDEHGLDCKIERSLSYDDANYFDPKIEFSGRMSSVAAVIQENEIYKTALACDRGPSKEDKLEEEIDDLKQTHKKLIENIQQRFEEESDNDLLYSSIWDKALEIVKEEINKTENEKH